MSTNRVIVVGSTNTDLVVPCHRLPGPGETVLGGDLLTFAGGKGANQAVAAARAGAKAHFIGAFGGDAFGRARRADLEREGIDCSGCAIKKGAPSGVALIAIGKARGSNAENLIIVAPGANARLTPADVRRGMPKLKRGDIVLCSLEIPFTTVAQAFALAKRAGALRLLNPAPFPAGGWPKALCCDVITPNEYEFEKLKGAKRETLGRHFIVTLGALGVRWDSLGDSRSGDPVRSMLIPAPKVKPVDTVGAGDCFNGALAARLSEDSNLQAAIHFAVAAAALKVTRQGAQAGMPRHNEILKMIKTGAQAR